MATEIVAPLHFRTLLTAHSYLIADFYATWCPPCKAIAPVYAQLSAAHAVPGKVVFVKVNVDEQREIAAQYGITSMPTFMVFKDGKQIEEVKGADVQSLKRAVEAASRAAREASTAPEVKEIKKEVKPEVKPEVKEHEEGKTVSGSYGMTGGNSWKMSLH